MNTIAVIAVALAVGTWFGIRWNESKHRLDQTLQQLVMSTPLQEDWDKDKWDTELHEALDRDRWRWN
jgi:hypothetical protein